MKRKPKIDTYDPKIYPRILWVADDIEDLDKVFYFMKTNNPTEISKETFDDIIDDVEEGSSIAVTCPVMHRVTNKLGVLVILLDKECADHNVIAHESVHVADYFYNQLGLYTQDFVDGNEAYAYLVGWSAGCISDTLIKSKKYDNRGKQDNVGDREIKY